MYSEGSRSKGEAGGRQKENSGKGGRREIELIDLYMLKLERIWHSFNVALKLEKFGAGSHLSNLPQCIVPEIT